jgi:hypothetical protein
MTLFTGSVRGRFLWTHLIGNAPGITKVAGLDWNETECEIAKLKRGV